MKDLRNLIAALKFAEFETSSKFLVVCIFTACLIWSTLMATVGWGNTISDAHGFRQTQTAITSYYLAQGGPFLSYETPIFGYPWSIPFEFPLYQWVVAFTSKVLHLQLVQAGRLVSELFFALTLVAFAGVLAELRVGRVNRLIFLTLVIVSPQYIFWSRTFMIESTALFLSMAYLYFIVRYMRTRKLTDAGLGGLCGVLGALVKVTTFPAFALVGSAIYIYSAYREYRSREHPQLTKFFLPHLVPALFFACLPVLITSAWVRYTDQVRALNIVAGVVLSSSNLRTWNFGTLEQRFRGFEWIVLRVRTIPDLVGAPVSLLVSCLCLFLSRHRLVPFLLSIAGFLSAFLIFINLHRVHRYYAYSNGIFLLAAVSWGIVGLLEGKKWRKFLGIAVFLFCVFNSIARYYDDLHLTQMNNASNLDNLASEIRNVTQQKDVVLIFSDDWSSEIPFYSERRALIWPRWMEQDMDDPNMKEAIHRLGDRNIGAIVFCDGAQANTHLIAQAIETMRISGTPDYQDTLCAVYPSSGLRPLK
jgi:hypothetical protein